MKCRNSKLGYVFLIIFLLSFLLWFGHNGTTAADCEGRLKPPVNLLGLYLMVISFCGLTQAFCRLPRCGFFDNNKQASSYYIFINFVLILWLFGITIFGFIVTNNNNNNNNNNNTGSSELADVDVSDYSYWLALQKRLVNDSINWYRINICLIDAQICHKLAHHHRNTTTTTQFLANHFSPIESGCCKPPENCNFKYESPTNWTKSPSSGATNTNPDCGVWDNNMDTLCYDCNSCKVGFLQNLKSDWKKVAVINIVIGFILTVLNSIGWCLCKNL